MVFTAAFLTGVFFFAAFAGAAFFTAAFLRAIFFGTAAARFKAHRFFTAATIAFLPAAESFRLAFGASGLACADGSASPRIFAHRRRWASFIRRRVSAENFLRLPGMASGVVAAWPGRLGTRARTSAI